MKGNFKERKTGDGVNEMDKVGHILVIIEQVVKNPRIQAFAFSSFTYIVTFLPLNRELTPL